MISRLMLCCLLIGLLLIVACFSSFYTSLYLTSNNKISEPTTMEPCLDLDKMHDEGYELVNGTYENANCTRSGFIHRYYIECKARQCRSGKFITEYVITKIHDCYKEPVISWGYFQKFCMIREVVW